VSGVRLDFLNRSKVLRSLGWATKAGGGSSSCSTTSWSELWLGAAAPWPRGQAPLAQCKLLTFGGSNGLQQQDGNLSVSVEAMAPEGWAAADEATQRLRLSVVVRGGGAAGAAAAGLAPAVAVQALVL
jgi:hypothetical protein